eukprot:TRINITY_DN13464_c0_g1_i1.p1 TRINITY_DN13464_c0_g1~~TRINITY_DN13464_c0_g1_i1.p1  ORF type:complete len:485 (+),score=108.63 TRINITY_DN13464_c0_g1_i1:57-1511(+)
MAMSCAAEACDCEPWRERHEEAQRACTEGRYFEAVQLINGAIESLERSLDVAVGLPQGLLLTDPPRVAEEFIAALGGGTAAELAKLYATHADILMNLGGLKRAEAELAAAGKLAPEDSRVADLFAECRRLQQTQDQAVRDQAELAKQDKIPAHLLTGFLGSGKTTLLNHILKGLHGKRLAVIENEFGEIGIDDALITSREDLGAEQIIEMNNGCICCTVRGDLIKGLKNILQRTAKDGVKLDGVIIETTGLADPAPVAQTFFADDYIQARMVLDGIITVVDAKHLLQHLHEEKPEGVENEAVEQVAFADRILVNKTDLVEATYLEEVEAEIRKINRFAPLIRTKQACVELDQIIGIRGFSLDRVLEAEPEFLRDDQDHEHDATVSSVGIERSGQCELGRLNAWIGTLLKERGTDIFRMKGILNVKGCESPFVYQGIHMIFGGQPQGEWKSGEARLNKLIFIGRNLDRTVLEAGFAATLEQPSET